MTQSPIKLTLTEESGVRILEGPPDLPLMRSIEDAGLVVEACFNNRVWAVVLYPPNLTEKFFDLSSGEAGAILQKLRQYRIRLAIVCPPDTVQFSSRFGEMMREESRGNHVQLLDSVQAAREWLSRAQ